MIDGDRLAFKRRHRLLVKDVLLWPVNVDCTVVAGFERRFAVGVNLSTGTRDRNADTYEVAFWRFVNVVRDARRDEVFQAMTPVERLKDAA